MNPARLKWFHALHPGGKAFDYQVEWCGDKAKYKLGTKARQIGITTTEAVDQFLECFSWHESEENPTPIVVAFCSPSQRQSQRLMSYVQRARSRFEKLVKKKIEFKKEQMEYLLFANGCEIWSLPNNPRTIEGIDINRGIIDEFGNFTHNEDKQVYDALMASTAAKGGGITVFGKPRGRRGLFWELADPYGEFFRTFSVHQFPYSVRARSDRKYSRTVEEHRLRMTTLSFKENYECEFIDEGIVILPWQLLDRQTDEDLILWSKNTQINTQFPLYMGIDFAKKHDKTAIYLVEHGDKNTWVRYKETIQGSFDIQIPRIEKAISHFSPTKCFVDKTGLGLPLLDILEAKFATRVEGVQFTMATKEKMVLNLRNLLEEGRLKLPDDRTLKEQLHGFEKEVTDQGNPKYTGKRTETDWLDDEAWALALACSQLGAGDFQFAVAGGSGVKKKPTYDEMWARDLDEDGNPL